ncbi:TSC complex subunit 1a [Notolabrus celidotus]|uniref:TSC complex subunit 1a n=1 Tax=Notolabrus celidotus TaxID=1203425 RepID=UPI00149079AD|nr:TSC complex subunit 1a [Notolabrus celidotus]XP_034547559.1 TSC complex subunit 1a [Notolabrus celidotus]
MSREQVSISELLLSLDSPELQEAEQVRAAVNQQLSTDKGGAVLSSLVEYYLDSSSSQAVVLLSSIREPHHKHLLEKLNESLSRPGTRLAGLTLLGHLIRKQPPWVHHISRSPLLPSLLRSLKTDTDVVVLITGVLVLITLLPMIPQAGKQHIYDFFDVFGRLASWSYKNPGHVPVVHLVHLHAGVYSLFHRLYGMFPCNFISYLRLHYSMKENLDTFQEVVKPMLEHVRVHPELVTGTQDYELDPSRWRCYEVHDIVIECSRVSLDPLESSCEEDVYPTLRDPPPSSPRPPTLSSPLPLLNLSPEAVCSSGGSGGHPTLTPLALNNSYNQADDVTWSPSSQCGLSTPPPELAATGSAPPLSRTTSVSGVRSALSATVPTTPLTEEKQDGGLTPDCVKPTAELRRSSILPITEKEGQGQSDVINNNTEEVRSETPPPSSSSSSSQPVRLTSTPSQDESSSGSALLSPPCSISMCHTPTHPSAEGGGSAFFDSAHRDQSPAPPYEALFELALPRAATLLIGRKTQEILEKAGGEQERKERREGEDKEEEQTSISPLEVLDQLIIYGHEAHEHLSRRLSGVNKSVDRSHFGGKQQSMKTKGPAQGEELQSLRSQLLLVHGQLQYERFKRQQHAMRNRRLLRRVINATTLEEQSVAMKGQLSVQDGEIRSLKSSLQKEQQRYTQLQQDTHTQTDQLHTHVQQLLLQQQDGQRDNQRLQSELQECQSMLRDAEVDLQKANNKAYNAEHQLTQLSLKLCSSEQLQQQIFLLNQQLVLLRETNRRLTEQLEGGETHHWTEMSMLQCSVGKEYQRLKDSDVQHRQKLEAANHRIAELESQLAKRDQLILDQKKLLEETKAQSRAELSACQSRCLALRRVTQTLQTEMLHLYSQVHLDSNSQSQDSRPNGRSAALPAPQGIHKLRPSSSSVGILNGGLAALSTSPLHLPSCSSSPLSLSPIESPLAVGSFLEQHSRQLFRPTNHSQGEEEQHDEEQQQEEEEKEEAEEVEDVHQGSPPLVSEAEEVHLLAGSPQTQPPDQVSAHTSGPAAPPADLTLAVRQRRHELSIMDYDETLPEY